MRIRLLLAALCVVCVLHPTGVDAVDYNLAGSLQLDYLYVPFSGADPRPSTFVLDGFTEELSLKLAVDITAHASANVKVCYGCHGFEADMGYVDYRFADELTVRFGRFNPTFGEFGLRHDPGNHRLSDKPLPYDMGRMLHLIDFNRSVLPMPYVDNGVELSGTHFFGSDVQISYAAYVVSGLRSLSGTPTDVDFVAMREAAPYYIDNNSQPSVGGRLGATFRLAERADLTLGASGMWGNYDNNAALQYLIVGGDAYLRVGHTNLRAEYLIRRTEMAVSPGTNYEYQIPLNANGTSPSNIFMVKYGWYIELEQPLTRALDVIVRWDGIRQLGNVIEGSPIGIDAGISRYTLGFNYTLERGYRLKASVEEYQYWGLSSGTTHDTAVHLGAVATF